MSELKKCYHCGGEAVIVESYNRKVKRYLPAVKCLECGCRTTTFNDVEQAIEAWNTKNPLERALERLEEELKLADEEKERCSRENQLQFDSAKGYATGIYNAIEIIKEEVDL